MAKERYYTRTYRGIRIYSEGEVIGQHWYGHFFLK